ncbi:MAG: hypothetical protein LBJ86_04265 [Spirochaetaceae bacterium]|jgi:hypothetical protein|nr:hypothetical protein [Spirochaetaceae bacterium]
MKRENFFVAIVILALSAAPLSAQQSPFILPATERWQGRVNYSDPQGMRRSDLYEIIFTEGGTCIVSVNARADGGEVYFDADGLWSESADTLTGASVLRIECDFPDSPLEYPRSVRWASVYQFDSGNTRFTLLVPPYPDAPRNARVQFVRVAE